MAGGLGALKTGDFEDEGQSEDPDPKTFAVAELLATAGYGFHFNEQQRLLLQLNVPLLRAGDRNGFANSTHIPIVATALDAYFQLRHTPFDLGVGLLLGLGAAGYVEAGYGFEIDGGRIGLDGGYRVYPTIRTLAPFVLASFRSEHWLLGVWSDALYVLGEPYRACDDTCSVGDYLNHNINAGLVVGYSM